MKNKIVLTFMVLSLSIMLFGCGTNAESETDTNFSDKVEETDETNGTNATNSELETDEQNNFTYDFEGKYWVIYRDYGSSGYYFDGTNVTALVTVGGEQITPYSVKDGLILFTYEEVLEYNYYIEDGNLYLFPNDGSMEICCVEVDKAEFDSLFSEGTHSEETTTTEEMTEQETETLTEESTTEEVDTEVQNNYTHDFEGRYWVEYGEYSNGGYYFDGTNATVAFGEEKNIQPYSVVDGFIMITYEDGCYDELCYFIEGNTMYLAMGEQERCFVEVDKAEFEKLFN